MTQKAQKFWDKQAKSYDRAEKQFADVYTDIIAKTCNCFTHNDMVLDYGCATGSKNIELLKQGGWFISTTACMKDKMAFKTSLEVTMFLLMKGLGISPLHLNRFKSTEVTKIIEDQHFKIVEAENITEEIPAIFIIARK